MGLDRTSPSLEFLGVVRRRVLAADPSGTMDGFVWPDQDAQSGIQYEHQFGIYERPFEPSQKHSSVVQVPHKRGQSETEKAELGNSTRLRQNVDCGARREGY